MIILYLKVAHIIGIVAWFAGLFYLPRLFVYDVEAPKKYPKEAHAIQSQLRIMQHKLYYYIMAPAMIWTWVVGLALAEKTGALVLPWFHAKFLLVILLTFFHITCGQIIFKLKNNIPTMNGVQFRIFNELPTIALIAIVSLAVLREGVNIRSILMASLLGFSLMLVMIRRKR